MSINCAECDQTFTHRSSLTRHIARKHRDELNQDDCDTYDEKQTTEVATLTEDTPPTNRKDYQLKELLSAVNAKMLAFIKSDAPDVTLNIKKIVSVRFEME